MGKTNTSKGQKKETEIIEFHKLVKTPGFTDEFHDIFDPVIHGNRGIMEIRFALENKSKDPMKDSKFFPFNNMLKAKTNKIAAWDVGSAHMALPKVFPCPEIVMLCAKNYDENRKAIVNKITQEEILSITESEFASLLDLGFETKNSNVHIDLGKLAETYEKIDAKQKDSYIRGIKSSSSLGPNHKPPYDYDIFVPWVQDSISLLAFCLGLDSNKEVGASILEMIFHIHIEKEPVKYNFIERTVHCMQEQLLLIKTGSQKTFRFTTYLCYLLLAKHRAIFQANKLQCRVQNAIYEWTPEIRMTDNRRNYNNFVDFFFTPMYHKITGTPLPRLPVSCRDCIQLGSQIQLADWYFMEDYTVLRFYGSAVEPYKLPIHVTERVFALEYVRQMESTDALFNGQQKKMIFPSLPFSLGGFTFERRGFKVAEAFFSIFRFAVDIHWQYDPLNIIGSKLRANGSSASKCQHESMPLIEKFKNMESWDEVKKEMEKYAAENNISIQGLSSQIIALQNQKVKVQQKTSYNFYQQTAQPSTKAISNKIMIQCKSENWTATKIKDFWQMRKNLGEPKTSADLYEAEEDEIFSDLWNAEHPGQAHSSDYDDQGTEFDFDGGGSVTVATGVSESTKEKYGKGAEMVEKMGFSGRGGLGPTGEGNWFPLATPAPPKRGETPVIGDSSEKCTTLSLNLAPSFVRALNPVPPLPSTQIQSESSATPTSGTGVDMDSTSGQKRSLRMDMKSVDPIDQGSVKKQKVMTTTGTTMLMPMVSVTVSNPPDVSNPVSSPPVSNPLVSSIFKTTGGSSYIAASSISPFKHSIVSQTPDFHFNDFVHNFEQTKNSNKLNSKTLKRDADAAARDAKPASNRLFPTYDPNKEMMEFMVVMPPARDNNPPESQIDPSEFQVSTLQMDLSKIKNVDKINVSKMTNQVVYSSVMKLERENGKLQGRIEKLKADLASEKAKEKAADNRCKELQKRIKNSSSKEAIEQQEHLEAELKIVREKLENSNKNLEKEKTSSVNLYKSVESRTQVNNILKKELEDERVKAKQWEEKARQCAEEAEKIKKHCEHQLSELREELKKANNTIKTNENSLNEQVKNTVRQIKKDLWVKIKASGDRLCDWFELNESLADVFGKLKEHIDKNKIFCQREKTAKQILHQINTTSDRHLASKGIQDRVQASIKTTSVVQKCQRLKEVDETLSLFERKLAKMNQTTIEMIGHGLPSPGPSNSLTNFVGREAYKRRLQETMATDLGKLPQDTTPEGVAKCIKPLTNLNSVLEGSLLSSYSNKYEWLTRLQVIYYNLTNIVLPNDAEWSLLNKLAEQSHQK